MRALVPSLVILCLISGVSSNSLAQTNSERFEQLIQQWLGLEQQADQLQYDWRRQKQVLEQRLQLLNAEKASIKKHLAQHSGRQSKAQQARADLAGQQNLLEQNQTQLKATLQSTLASIQAIAPRLPEPLAQHWQKTLMQSEAHKSNSEKLDRYLSLLKSLEEFQHKITRHQSLMTIDGKEVLTDQIYLGLAQGWYVSRDGKLAGIGLAGEESWDWHSDHSLAEMLKEVLHSLDQPENAKILPIRVRLADANTSLPNVSLPDASLPRPLHSKTPYSETLQSEASQ